MAYPNRSERQAGATKSEGKIGDGFSPHSEGTYKGAGANVQESRCNSMDAKKRAKVAKKKSR